tara:strand:+ start:10531 stop:11385 length:855 start_codon:yes stop_codon:yes gene_type:complete
MNYINTNNVNINNFNVKSKRKNLLNFLAIRKTKNILFIGSCRLYSIINYCLLLDIFTNNNIYYVYVPDFGNKQVPIEIINKIIKNTEIIIYEKVSNFKFLNTHKEVPYNIFETYDMPKRYKIVDVSNLECPMYYKGLLKYSPENKTENFFKIRSESFQRLNNKLLNNQEYNIKECIDKYLFNQKFPLFYTINHPSSFLSMLSFKNICDNLRINIPSNKLLKNYATDLHYFSLFGNNTTLTHWDQRMYNIQFCTNFKNDYCKSSVEQNQYKIDKELEKKILVDYI